MMLLFFFSHTLKLMFIFRCRNLLHCFCTSIHLITVIVGFISASFSHWCSNKIASLMEFLAELNRFCSRAMKMRFDTIQQWGTEKGLHHAHSNTMHTWTNWTLLKHNLPLFTPSFLSFIALPFRWREMMWKQTKKNRNNMKKSKYKSFWKKNCFHTMAELIQIKLYPFLTNHFVYSIFRCGFLFVCVLQCTIFGYCCCCCYCHWFDLTSIRV